MKRHLLHSTAISLLSTLLLCLSPGRNANASVLINFNTPGDLSSNFTQNTNGTGGTFSQSLSGGIADSGSVALSSGDGTTAVYTGPEAAFDLATGNPLTVSLFFHIDSTVSGSYIAAQLGIVTDTTGDLRLASPYEALRVQTTSTAGTYQLLLLTQTTTGGSVTSNQQGGNYTLSTGFWYLLTATFSAISSTQLSVSGSIVDYGTEGTTPGSTVTSFNSFTVTNAALASDSSVYGAFRGNSLSGVNRFDNFAMVPEPSTTILSILGAFAVIVLGRRKSASSQGTRNTLPN